MTDLARRRERLTLLGFVLAHAGVGLLGVMIPPERPAEAQLLSPGALSRDHARLEGDAKCSECHSAGRRVDTNRCLHCHDALAAQIRARRGLHGREYRGRDCGTCHVEHLGRGAAQIRWPNGGRDRFDHRTTGWPLGGAHARAGCDDCHETRSFLGLQTRCASCHEDPHRGRFGARCESCHDERDFRTPVLRNFDHGTTRYPLVGAHQRTPCAGCHTGTPPRYRDLAFDTCNSCHEDPHAGRLPGPCASCHVETSFRDVSAVRDHHPGLSLAHGHANVRCESCHDRGLDVAPSRGARCVSCHQPVHEADFGPRCESCHQSIQWTRLPRPIGLAAHARTAYPLHGEHVDVPCSSCHRAELPAQQRYRELASDTCASCHEDPHGGTLRRYDGGECGSCHEDTGFAPTRFDVARHASTDFPLDGRHEAVACGRCHVDPRPRLSWSVEAQACADCHTNPHGDQFAREMREGGCASCHSTTDWERPTIDHSGWPLTGAHARAACDTCHRPTDADRQAGRGASYRGVPRDCEGCHTDRHAGQFRLSTPERGCGDCHTTEAFTITPFDHAGLTGFALDGRHVALECTACHRETTLRDGTTAVAYRLGYRRCRDCHQSPHGSSGR